MKNERKDASNFKKMGAADMKRIDGGTWVNIPQPDGTLKPVWV